MKPFHFLTLAALGIASFPGPKPAFADAPALAYTITGLGNLGTGTSGESFSDGLAINRAGQVTGVSTVYDASGQYGGNGAFLYSQGRLISLGTPGAVSQDKGQTTSVVINGMGQVALNGNGYDATEQATGSGAYTAAYLYANSELIPLGTLATGTSHLGDCVARGINDSGQIVGQSTVYDTPTHYVVKGAFLYSDGQMINLCGHGTQANGSNSDALGINNAGQVVGSYDLDGQGGYLGRMAFLYSGGRLIDLGTLGKNRAGHGSSTATAINRRGQVIGESDVYEGGVERGRGAFLYSQGRMINLGNFGVDAEGRGTCVPVALNDAGEVVGQSGVFGPDGTSKGSAAFLYSGGRLINLGSLGVGKDGTSQSSALAINSGGQVLGLSNGRPFLYSGGKFYDLTSLITNRTGWQGLTVAGINDAGQIVERGGHSLPGQLTAHQEAFLLTPLPSP